MSREYVLSLDLAGKVVRLRSGEDVATYNVIKRIGDGETAAAWLVKNRHDRQLVLKTVSADDYRNHSLEAEVQHVQQLGQRFAKFYEYGTLQLEQGVLSEDVYGLILEHVEGETLQSFNGSSGADLTVPQLLLLFRQMCEALADLERCGLVHDDLHDRNVLIVSTHDALTGSGSQQIKVIDTGTLKTRERHDALLDRWRLDLTAMRRAAEGAVLQPHAVKIMDRLQGGISWFSRTDQEWVVHHVLQTAAAMTTSISSRKVSERRFLLALPVHLEKMLDEDRSMRVAEPQRMLELLETLWSTSGSSAGERLPHAFDYISAELIQSDSLLNKLFSAKCPWYSQCLGSDPIYLYGPRGCGKSTVMRMLSLPAVLSAESRARAFASRAYIGVYISCIAELKARFLQFDEERYRAYDSDIVRYFCLLLVERLLENLELLCDGAALRNLGEDVGLNEGVQRKLFEIALSCFGGAPATSSIGGMSWVCRAKRELHRLRRETWERIVNGTPSSRAAEPHKLHECVQEMAKVFPLLQDKRVAFLLDDYSNQRIPARLQRILNQAITLTKTANPIFKISSEYDGVDLTGVQEGREVVEINCGAMFVSLDTQAAPAFIEDVLDIRLNVSGTPYRTAEMLGKSGVSPGEEMAQLIQAHFSEGPEFHYHGVDTIAHVCSGDLSMALDLVKRIHHRHRGDERLPIAKRVQHEVIQQFAAEEHRHLRFYLPHGQRMEDIIDRLCWLAQESAAKCTEIKEAGRRIPIIRTSLDIKTGLRVAGDLEEILRELIKRGAFFSLDTSRTRRDNVGTLRYQIRRILLARYLCPLARRTAIKIDNDQKLVWLLNDPEDFTRRQLEASLAHGAGQRGDRQERTKGQRDNQSRIDFNANDNDKIN